MISKLCLKIFIIIICSGIYFPKVNSQENCLTVDGISGNCINIRQCRPLLNLLMAKPILPASLERLQRSQCGFEGSDPKVCCSVEAINRVGAPLPETSDNVISSSTTGIGETSPSRIIHRNLKLLPTNCGDADEDRMYRGNKTATSEFKWMVLLNYSTPTGFRFQCGGTIINSRYILTAAHCLTNLGENNLVGVRVGEHNLDTELDCDWIYFQMDECAPKYQDMDVDEVVVHPQYIHGNGSNGRHQNDIGLIRLSQEIDLIKSKVFPICLPIIEELQELSMDDLTMQITGWGASTTGPTSNALLKFSIPVVDNARCGQLLGNVSVDSLQMCAGGWNGVDSCGGDSGGPLQHIGFLDKTYKHIQHGILSSGSQKCGSESVPGVYTRVSNYMEWILDSLKP